MSRSCTVCASPARSVIDSQLQSGRAAARVARDYGLSEDAMGRHVRNRHVASAGNERHDAARQKSSEKSDLNAGADPLDELIASLRQRALSGSDAASREYRLALQTRADRGAAQPEYDVLRDPEWLDLREIMLDALRPFPEARYAIADALRARDPSLLGPTA